MGIQNMAITVLIIVGALAFVYAAIIFVKRRKKWPPHQQSAALISKKKTNTFQIMKQRNLL
jgi:hypothetical protein